jgi:hypothetical protein
MNEQDEPVRKRKSRTNKTLNDFHLTLRKALLRVECKLRAEQQQECFLMLHHVFIKDDVLSKLTLYNLKIWSMRYHVSLDFVLETLLRYWHKVRKTLRGSISLGVSIGVFTGEKARLIVKEAVEKAFPDGENLKIKMQIQPRFYKINPSDNLDQWVREYTKSIEKSRVEMDRHMKQLENPRRNYRRF